MRSLLDYHLWFEKINIILYTNYLSDWTINCLDGRKNYYPMPEILIKIVAQVVPTYTMSVFKLPNTLCDEMMSMVRHFWWGQANEKEKKKMALLS